MPGDVQGAGRVVGDQRLDAKRHVGKTARGIEARANDETEIDAVRLGRIASRRAKQGKQSRIDLPVAHPLQSLADQDAVIVVELDDIRYRAEGHQIK